MKPEACEAWGMLISYIVFALVVAAVLWWWYFAPCSWFAWLSVSQLPVRCLREYLT